MPRIRTLQRSFVGGIISPSLWGHVEDSRRLTGADEMENMVPMPQGRMCMRPGTFFVGETSDSTKASVLRPFGAGSSTSYVVGFEEGKFRFYFEGAQVLWGHTRLVSSIDTSSEEITFTKPHGWVSNDQVRLIRPGASTTPTGLSTTTLYYVIFVSATKIKVSVTPGPGAAVNITSTGSGALYFVTAADLPATYVGSKNATSVDAGTEQVQVTGHGLSTANPVEFTSTIDFTANAGTNLGTAAGHNIVTGTPVTVTSSGTLPGGLVAGTTYYIEVAGVNTFYFLTRYVAGIYGLAASPYLVDITSAGSGTHTIHVATGGQVIDAVPPVVAGTTYYARFVDADNFLLYPTAADANAATNLITITTAGLIGTLRMHYAYLQGDMVNFPNSGVYYAEISHPQDVAPGTPGWHLMPFTGEYEIPNVYVEADLPYIQYRQRGDSMRLAHPSHGVYDLVRESEIRWTFSLVSLLPPIDPPTNVVAAPTVGEYLSTSFTAATPAVFTSATDHGFAAGITTIYVTVLTGTLAGGSNPYIVNTTPSSTTFTIKTVTGGAVVGASVAGTATVQRNTLSADLSQTYYVTAIGENGIESLASASVIVANDLTVIGAYNQISWTAVTGAISYRVYKNVNGLIGFLGDTLATTFKDDGTVGIDAGFTVPRATSLTGNPGVIASFETRDIYSGVTTDSQRIWFTALGTEGFLTYHIPVIDTDRIDLTVESTLAAAVKHIMPTQNLVILTESTEFVMTTINSDALTPSDYKVRPVSYIGASFVRPALVNDKIVFVANRGGHLYEFSLREAFEGYKPKDLCNYAPHLFDGYTILDMAFQRAPFSCLWVVRSDGALLGFTYLPEEEVAGWHLHTTDGDFESICVVAEGEEDRIYAVVNRTINSTTKRYVERFDTFALKSPVDEMHADCAITYDGDQVNTISGLDHLEAKLVVTNVPATRYAKTTVASGTITLPNFASTIRTHVGLPYEGVFRSLPVVAAADTAAVQGRKKDPGRAGIRTIHSGVYKVGLTDDPVEDVLIGDIAASDVDPDTGFRPDSEELIKLPNSWTEAGQVYVRQPFPLPLNIVYLNIDFDLGGV